MITKLFLEGRARHALNLEEIAALDAAIGSIEVLPARSVLVRRSELVDRSYYLVEGYMLRYLDDRDGDRQLVGVQVPGDFVDLHSFAMKRLDHDVASLSTARLAVFPHAHLKELLKTHPHLARILWFATLLDAAMHREWIFRIGRLDATGRIAHLICELIERHRFVGLYDGRSFPVPLTQRDFAEACGITSVHSNRVFRVLRERGCVSGGGAGVPLLIKDEDTLRSLGEFDADYLYGHGSLEIGSALDRGTSD